MIKYKSTLVTFHVRNIDYNVSDKELRDSFNNALRDEKDDPSKTRIISMYRPKHKDTGKSMKYAFFSVREEDEKRFLELNGALFASRRVEITKKEEKAQKNTIAVVKKEVVSA